MIEEGDVLQNPRLCLCEDVDHILMFFLDVVGIVDHHLGHAWYGDIV